MGNLSTASCTRAAVYMMESHWTNRFGTESCTRLRACPAHGGAFALRYGVEIPMPVRVEVRRRDDDQQTRDVLARVARELRAMRRDQAEFYERLAGLFSLSSPSQRRLPLGMDAGEHRQRLFGDVRESVSG